MMHTFIFNPLRLSSTNDYCVQASVQLVLCFRACAGWSKQSSHEGHVQELCGDVGQHSA